MLAGATLVAGLVTGLLLLALHPARAGAGAMLGQPRAWLVGGGIVFPSVLLLALLSYGLAIGERPRAAPLRVTAEASRWQWTFGYPSLPGARATVGRLHIPAGRPVEVHVGSRDVIHSFWVPRLAGKVDAIPGRVTVLRLEAAAPGTYAGVCAEYCGAGHARHGFEVEAHRPGDWARTVGSGTPDAPAAP